jgi:hypothetical protein
MTFERLGAVQTFERSALPETVERQAQGATVWEPGGSGSPEGLRVNESPSAQRSFPEVGRFKRPKPSTSRAVTGNTMAVRSTSGPRRSPNDVTMVA